MVRCDLHTQHDEWAVSAATILDSCSVEISDPHMQPEDWVVIAATIWILALWAFAVAQMHT